MSKWKKTNNGQAAAATEAAPGQQPEEQLEEQPAGEEIPVQAADAPEAPAENTADTNVEEVTVPEAAAAAAAALEALKQELESTKKLLADAAKKQEEYLNMAQRVQADFENFRRRNQSVRKESYDDGTRDFAKEFLPVIDNLERAIEAAQSSPDASLKSGVELVLRQMTEALDKRGIQAINRLGKVFDPNLENAVMRAEPEEGEPGTVCAVFQKGYEMGGKLIRPAMVKVVPEN